VSTNAKPREASAAVGQRLREMRTSNHLTLREVADYTGLPVGMLSRIETGQRLVTVDDLAQLRECFGIPGVLYLIGVRA
jgi:transcriptional regulator with XRE-family HTH domain